MSLLVDAGLAMTLGVHYVWHRMVTGKYGSDAPEKRGFVPVREGERPCIWVHGVSVGEVMAAVPLVEQIEAAYPEWEVRVSTTTATGREVAQKRFGAERVFYFPMDMSWMVRRVFDRIRPSMLVLMELEVWPHLLQEAERRGVPTVVSNVRITERSVRRFVKLHSLAAPMLARVTLWLSQSQEYADRLRMIGVDPARIHEVGSLKYDQVKFSDVDENRRQYRALLGASETTRVFVAGSTHEGEDDPVLQAYCYARDNGIAELKLVLVPRHPERLGAVENLAKTFGNVQRRSTIDEASGAQADIILVDTMGELGKLYAAGDVAFMGGSLVPVGGHNVLESCGVGCPTLIGPQDFNFTDAVAHLKEAGGLVQIESAAALGPALLDLLQDAEALAQMADRGREAVAAMQGASLRTLDFLRPLLEGVRPV